MEKNENVRIRLLSGCNVDMSEKVHDQCYSNFDENKYFSFSNIINSGLYFPQIMQFIIVLIFIFNGKTSFLELFLGNLISGTIFTIIWFKLKMYKIPGLNFISCFIGGNIFRFFLHFIAIGIISLVILKDWKIILFCLIAGFVTTIIKSFLFANLSNVKYNDEVAVYVSNFKATLNK